MRLLKGEESLSNPSQLIFFGKRTAYYAVLLFCFFFLLPPTSIFAIKKEENVTLTEEIYR